MSARTLAPTRQKPGPKITDPHRYPCGHDRTPENTVTRTVRGCQSGTCRACTNAYQRRYKRDRRARWAGTATPHPVRRWITTTDPELTKCGWNWNYQCRVDAVIGESAMLQYFSAFDGYATNIKPIALSELLDGTWIFYASREAWLEAGDTAMARYHAEKDREHDAFERAVARACDCGRAANAAHRTDCGSFAERRRLCALKWGKA